MDSSIRYIDLFSGSGMWRLGLGETDWRCVASVEIDQDRVDHYRKHFGDGEAICGDIRGIKAIDMRRADVVVASSPCQDYSEAGKRAGSAGARSGLVGEWLRLIREMTAANKRPLVTVLENVPGILNSNDGQDIRDICASLIGMDYRVGLIEIDAAAFVPQSRRRVFVVAVDDAATIPDHLVKDKPGRLHSDGVVEAVESLAPGYDSKMVWLDAPLPKSRRLELADVLLDDGIIAWDSAGDCLDILMSLSELNQEKVFQARATAIESGRRQVGTLYRRTRKGTPVYEVRFDGVAGCLRTAAGGSSYQHVMVIEPNGAVNTRRLQPREAARLMGMPDAYSLPATQKAAYSMAGDGVVTDVVAWLGESIIKPIVKGSANGDA